jgi:hypothetical protein
VRVSKWALEAVVEALAIEVAPFGIDTALLEPGAVSSGALDDVTTYTVPDDPYAAPLEHHGGRDQVLTPEDVAAAVADAAAVANASVACADRSCGREDPRGPPSGTRRRSLRPLEPAAHTPVTCSSAMSSAASSMRTPSVTSASLTLQGGTAWIRLKLAKGSRPLALHAAITAFIAGLEPP